MKSDKKAEKYVKENKIFPIRKTTNSEYYGVEGETGVWEVRFDKLKDEYRCNCKNIRTSPCSHIKSIRIWKQQRSDKNR